MFKLYDGDNGKKNTSAIGIGQIALYVVRLKTATPPPGSAVSVLMTFGCDGPYYIS